MKKILITAGLHADEVGAILLAHELKGYFNSKNNKNITILPLVNKSAFKLKRRNQKDNKNLNRVFPGKKNGSPSEKLAKSIYDTAKRYDYVIDLHNYSNKRVCIPFLLIDLDNKKNKEFAKELGIKYAIQTSKTKGQMFVELSEREDIKSGIIEFAGSYQLNEKYHQYLFNKIIDFVKRIQGKSKDTKAIKEKPTIINHYEKIRSGFEGKLEIFPKLEEHVKKGDIIAKINENEIKSPYNGLVLAKLNKENYKKTDKHFIAIAEI
ncbi:MAG: succinylglutamate desuccinylase/aspartoacylase family protein [Candidatus Woesearchaeota archaeon]